MGDSYRVWFKFACCAADPGITGCDFEVRYVELGRDMDCCSSLLEMECIVHIHSCNGHLLCLICLPPGGELALASSIPLGEP